MNHVTFIQTCLIQASRIAVSNFGRVKAKAKPNDKTQVVTPVDLDIGNLFLDEIKHEFPTYNIIDEESGVVDNKSDFTWVIDAINGTSNYAVGVPAYGIMMGLLQGNTPIAGGFALPFTNEITIAEKGQGTFCNGKRIYVTGETQLGNSLIAYHINGHPEEPERTQKELALLSEITLRVRGTRNSGAEPIDGFYVAIGRYGALLSRTMKIWDIVAPHVIIEEAGGMFTDFWGTPVDYTDPLTKAESNFTCCAAVPELHKQLQEIINGKPQPQQSPAPSSQPPQPQSEPQQPPQQKP